jgi:hypothetical protein
LWHYGVNGAVFASSCQHFALRASLRRSNSSEFCVSKHGQKKKMLTHTHMFLKYLPYCVLQFGYFIFLFFLMRNLLCSNLFSIQKFERSQLKKIDKKVCEKYCGAKAEQQILVSLSQLISLYLIPPLLKWNSLFKKFGCDMTINNHSSII